MMINKKYLYIIIFSFIFVSFVFAETNKDKKDSTDGWHFYKEKIRILEKEIDKLKKDKPTQSFPATSQMINIQKQFQEIKNKAILNPTPKNVYNFLYFQVSMLNKSKKFSDVAKTVIYNNPELDANTYMPVGSFALDSAYKEFYDKFDKIIEKIFNTGGLIVFLDDSETSNQQKQPIIMLKDKYNPTIKIVSENNKIETMENINNINITKNFNITKFPSIIFLIPTNKLYYQITEGYVVTENNLYDRLLYIGLKANIINSNELPSLYKNTNDIKELNDIILNGEN